MSSLLRGRVAFSSVSGIPVLCCQERIAIMEFIDNTLGNPIVMVGMGVALLALLGLFFYLRSRRPEE
jgi:hypothetical protein